MKKILSVILILVLAINICGCDLYKGKRRVVALTYENELFDSMQNQTAFDGLKLLISSLKISYFENTDVNEFSNNLRTIIDEGHDFIWCFEPQSKDKLKEEAEKSPNTLFGLIDATYDKIPENIVTLNFREYEGGFLAGYAAEKLSPNHRIGFLAGKQSEVSKKYEVGFRAGALYSAKMSGNMVDVFVHYTNDDYSKASGKAGAQVLYIENGCDIIFHATQVTGLGAIEEAVALNKPIICSGKDQSSYGPKNVMFTVTKNVKNGINTVTTYFVDKEEIGGKNFNYGIKERVIGLSKTNVNLERKLYKELTGLRDDIADEKIKVPYDDATLAEFINSGAVQ